jgi:hypothetical protein
MLHVSWSHMLLVSPVASLCFPPATCPEWAFPHSYLCHLSQLVSPPKSSVSPTSFSRLFLDQLMFHGDCQLLTAMPSDPSVSKISITHSEDGWAGGTSVQHDTWTPLDENRQEILLDVCPSIHLWKITAIGWETGSKQNITYLKTDVQHITVTQREPSRTYDSSLIPDVQTDMQGKKRMCPDRMRPNCYDRQRKPEAEEWSSYPHGEITSRGLGDSYVLPQISTYLSTQKNRKICWSTECPWGVLGTGIPVFTPPHPSYPCCGPSLCPHLEPAFLSHKSSY